MFSINGSSAGLNALASMRLNQRLASESLEKLNSGLRINSAADDASGMQIADSLRSQANGLGMAIRNGQDALSLTTVADKAMDEQIKILDTIKSKSIQAASDTQTPETRKAIQQDISKLLRELDNIANTTSFNGQKLLSGNFNNKEFQIGAYSNETIGMSIGATNSDKIGLTRFETGQNVRLTGVGKGTDPLDGTVNITIKNADGLNDFKFESVKILETEKGDDKNGAKVKINAGMGLGHLAEVINKQTDKTGVRANVTTKTTFEQAIKEGETSDQFSINGVTIGKVNVKDGDASGSLVDAINNVSDRTGVTASVDSQGRLVLDNQDGRGILVEDAGGKAAADNNPATGAQGVLGLNDINKLNLGRLTLSKQGGRDIQLDVKDGTGKKDASGLIGFDDNVSEKTVSLKELNSVVDSSTADALGFNSSDWMKDKENANGHLVGVQSLAGSMAMISVAEASRKNLDSTRADIGSVQNQIKSTINNITSVKAQVKNSESSIRDVDFAAEVQNFQSLSMKNMLSSFVMSQNKQLTQSILQLLQ